MTPHQFIEKWKGGGDERRDAQPFFEDLCRLIGHPTPREADPDHKFFTYEYGATKATGGEGWADVWKKGFFGWEAKGTHKNLDKAYQQLKMYADALQNPPLLVVSDLQTIIVHTNFTNTVKTEYKFTIEDLKDHKTLDILRHVFNDPERLKPGKTRQTITEDAAKQFATLAEKLRSRKHPPAAVAHFLNRLLFCMFAEDIGLLPDDLFTKMVRASKGDPPLFDKRARELFAAMHKGGDVAFQNIPWFNGGLFDNDDTLPLVNDELDILLAACDLEWDEIDPSIFGTLFERGLDPKKRSQLGAHYTDPATIMRIVGPVVVDPWMEAWAAKKAEISALMDKADLFGPTAKTPAEKGARTNAEKAARKQLVAFLDSLRAFTVLDPACGSGNFLFLALRALKDIEHTIIVDAEAMGMGRTFPAVGPENVKGIELNEYAAELARITIWIGEIQWMIQHGYGANQNPILRPLDQIENRDALLNEDGSETSWPSANAIIGNPPFVGNKKMIGELGEDYVSRVRKAFDGRVPAGVDFVCYWFEKSCTAIEDGATDRTGLVATQAIRAGANRSVLERVVAMSRIFDAWQNEEWINEGAAVRVAITCFGNSGQPTRLDGEEVDTIFANLSAGGSLGTDLTQAGPMSSNLGKIFQGTTKGGSFDIPGELARAWLTLPNPNGRRNSDVVKPWANGSDVVRRPSDKWIIDFGTDMEEAQAAFYEVPFAHVLQYVKPDRDKQRRDAYRKNWWRHVEARSGLRRGLKNLGRYIATPRVAKHRLFAWLDASVLPDSRLYAIVRDDDLAMGILHSRIHEVWALATASKHGVGNDPTYNAASCFESFPFPEGMTLDIPAETALKDQKAASIEKATAALMRARDRWLNPPEWTFQARTPEESVAGFPERASALPGKENELKKRTLTNLYNEQPAWLVMTHKELDQAVAKAYGWEWPLTDDEIISRLFALNQKRVGV